MDKRYRKNIRDIGTGVTMFETEPDREWNSFSRGPDSPIYYPCSGEPIGEINPDMDKISWNF